MKIGILGTGVVGTTLGSGFLAKGHEVKMGSRDAANPKLQAWVKGAGARASGGSFGDVAGWADAVVLATLWSGTESALKMAGPERLKGKLVMDATNPLAYTPDGPPGLAIGHTDSGGEQIQRWLPGAKVVKVFNSVGNAHMIHPQFPGGPPDMFICGDDEEAKRQVTEFCAAFGWPTIDLGGIAASRLLEPMCILWVVYGVRSKSWNHAFKLLRK